MKGYFHPWRDHPQILSFGILLTLFSSFGQTFLIAIFVPRILSDFDLSEGDFGTLYAVATVCSALSLPLFGRLLDRLRLGVYSVSAGLGLAAACLAMSLAESVPVLFSAILGLRLTGQGLMGLTASTAMARSFEAKRGKALSVSGLGYPLGEGLLPMAMVLLIGAVGWRWSWGVLAASTVLILLPCIIGLVRHVPDLEVRGCELEEGTSLLFGALLDAGIGFGAIVAGSFVLGLVAILCARSVLVRWAAD